LRDQKSMVVALALRSEPGAIVPLDRAAYILDTISRASVPARVRVTSPARDIPPGPYAPSGEDHLGRHVDVRV
jgi:hypothetical protein